MELVFLAIGLFCTIPAYIAGRRRRVKNIDYKDRWAEAVELLASEGKVTDRQVKALLTGKEVKSEDAANEWEQLRQVKSLGSQQRYELEMYRTRQGLPPLDDLEGIGNTYRTAILKERLKMEVKAKELESE